MLLSHHLMLHSADWQGTAPSAHRCNTLHLLQAAKTMSGVEVSAWGAVRNWRTWYLAVINLCDSTVKYAIIYWCPLIIYHMVGENMPHTTGEAVVPHDALVALLTALPFGFAAVFMLVNARHSAATGQQHSDPVALHYKPGAKIVLVDAMMFLLLNFISTERQKICPLIFARRLLSKQALWLHPSHHVLLCKKQWQMQYCLIAYSWLTLWQQILYLLEWRICDDSHTVYIVNDQAKLLLSCILIGFSGILPILHA